MFVRAENELQEGLHKRKTRGPATLTTSWGDALLFYAPPTPSRQASFCRSLAQRAGTRDLVTIVRLSSASDFGSRWLRDKCASIGGCGRLKNPEDGPLRPLRPSRLFGNFPPKSITGNVRWQREIRGAEARSSRLKKMLLPLLLALKLKMAVVLPILLAVVKFISLKGLIAGLMALKFSVFTVLKDLFAKKKERVTTAYITSAQPVNAEIVHQDWKRYGDAPLTSWPTEATRTRPWPKAPLLLLHKVYPMVRPPYLQPKRAPVFPPYGAKRAIAIDEPYLFVTFNNLLITPTRRTTHSANVASGAPDDTRMMCK
ncbi:AGAP003466-PA-like protein [Anopheles sinensis]|uniref:AGAP003466-PA-like protein n=1 Tax=Anopheles sinensis TaxID=74873 RepID=A0A084WNR5_ANOSI|nr:AGAP003466-PA-like protein [Anopheles sinensis]